MTQYKIYIDNDDIITVCRIVEGHGVRAFYFCAGGDEEGTAQELYDLLKSAGVEDVRIGGGTCER